MRPSEYLALLLAGSLNRMIDRSARLQAALPTGEIIDLIRAGIGSRRACEELTASRIGRRLAPRPSAVTGFRRARAPATRSAHADPG